MKKVFRIHGYGGEPNGGWAPWLLGELAKQSIWACAPQMPTPQYPIPDEWVAELSRQIGEPSSEIVIVGHSLGSTAILRYLETLPKEKHVAGIILVSGFVSKLPLERHRPLDVFTEHTFDFDHIQTVAGKIIVIHAIDDDAVPHSYAEEIAEKLHAELIMLPKGKHLNANSGCFELPEALEAVKKIYA